MKSVLAAYGFEEESAKLETFGSGLINRTWKVAVPEGEYILQRVNHDVFKKPDFIAHNIRVVSDYLQQHHPDYCFVTPIVSGSGSDMIYLKEKGYFRLFPFVTNSHSKEVVETPEQAFEAAAQFGKFTRLLSGFDVGKLHVTIPDFHNLEVRYQQFLTALKKGNQRRCAESKELVSFLIQHENIVSDYKNIRVNKKFKLRATHHDTKISNVLFDAEGKGICVIDLDTIMPGYFFSDVGDMMRTYLSPVNEEEKDFNKIEIREEFYKAIVEGYGNEMKNELTTAERNYFFYAGKFMIYMQALRFLTDYLNNDVYYGAKYPEQNFVRAKNQAVMLRCLSEKEKSLVKYNV